MKEGWGRYIRRGGFGTGIVASKPTCWWGRAAENGRGRVPSQSEASGAELFCGSGTGA
jgi:hypothetical protein